MTAISHWRGQPVRVTSGDLLTAGLGADGLASPTPPSVADAERPTDEELRCLAIHTNYRGLVCTSREAGYGTLYGPRPVPGKEYRTVTADGVALMVQVPENFDTAHPCIVAAPSSGSRSEYGAIGTAGEWALKRGFAVAYTDCGKGTGLYDLDTGRSISGFTAPAVDPAFIKQYPHRIAFTHAHSQQNPERQWGDCVLESIAFAQAVLQTPVKPTVIAASVSNGGDAVLQAGERDTQGVIDAIVAGEPNGSPGEQPFKIAFEGHPVVEAPGKDLLDYTTLVNLYGPAACGDVERLQALVQKGLLQRPEADEAWQRLEDAGLLPEARETLPQVLAIGFPESIGVAYTNEHGRFSVSDHVAGYSYVRKPEARLALLPGTSTGIFPANGIDLVNDEGSRLDGAIRLRSLFEGRDIVTGKPLDGEAQEQHKRLQTGLQETRMTANVHGKPTLVLVPRNDQVIAPDHGGRAWYGANKLAEADSPVSLIEIDRMHHLDALNAGERKFVNMSVYFQQALDTMWEHLQNGTALPPSQVIHPDPTTCTYPAFEADPARRITFDGATLSVPQ